MTSTLPPVVILQRSDGQRARYPSGRHQVARDWALSAAKDPDWIQAASPPPFPSINGGPD